MLCWALSSASRAANRAQVLRGLVPPLRTFLSPNSFWLLSGLGAPVPSAHCPSASCRKRVITQARCGAGRFGALGYSEKRRATLRRGWGPALLHSPGAVRSAVGGTEEKRLNLHLHQPPSSPPGLLPGRIRDSWTALRSQENAAGSTSQSCSSEQPLVPFPALRSPH